MHKFLLKKTIRFTFLICLAALFTESCGCTSKTPKKRKKKELENEQNEAHLFVNSKTISIT